MEVISVEKLAEFLKAGLRNLEAHREEINKLNVFPVPDGDTGTNMFLTMKRAFEEADSSFLTVGEFFTKLSRGALLGARGNSGVILSQLIRGMAERLNHAGDRITPKDWIDAWKEGVDVAYRAVIKPVEGTMLTVMREASEVDDSYVSSFQQLLREMLRKAQDALERTPEMLEVLKEAGVVDAGGKGIVKILEGIYLASIGKELPSKTTTEEPSGRAVVPTPIEEGESLNFPYCTEFILRGTRWSVNSLREKLRALGESLVIVGDGQLVKVHIHTKNPVDVLNTAIRMGGEFVAVKVENMKDQHQEMFKDLKEDRVAVVAVVMGEGFRKIFQELGAKVVNGGQTLNPSVETIAKAIHETRARYVIVLPNNKNIIMSAEKAAELVGKGVSVRVVPTISIPQGIAALLNFDPEASLDDNFYRMKESLSSIHVGEVTIAVRDSTLGGKEIRKGQYIGFVDGDLVSVDSDMTRVVKSVVAQLVELGGEILSLYKGQDLSGETVELIVRWIASTYPDVEVEVVEGGQPFYPLIISIE